MDNDTIKHDKIVEAFARNLEKSGKNVKRNTEAKKEASIKVGGNKLYPDLLVIEDNKIKELYEVETEESISIHRITRWKIFSEQPSDFFFVVPKGSVESLKKITMTLDIKKVITY